MARLLNLSVNISTDDQTGDDHASFSYGQKQCELPSLRNRLKHLEHNLSSPNSAGYGFATKMIRLERVSFDPETLVRVRLGAWLIADAAAERASRLLAAEKILEAYRLQSPSLNLDHLKLSSVPDCLEAFSCLKILKLRDNHLVSLPSLPPGLLELKAGSNQLRFLPELPASLKELSVYRNTLTQLPVLPSHLQRLHVYENQLINLPELPPTLERLLASSNALSQCPPINDVLTLVNLSGNCLADLPEELLDQVNRLSNSAQVIRQYQQHLK